jgi:hypothetical protein
MQGIQDHDEGSIGFRVSSSDEFVFTVPRGKRVRVITQEVGHLWHIG